MRVGAFELLDSVLPLHEPQVLAILKPWIDVNNVGSMVLKEVGMRFDATELGRIKRPGNFYDFTRYRPTIHIDQGIEDVSIPNTTIHYARRDDGDHDILLLRMLEPHAHAEHYIDSVLEVLLTLKVRKYILLGSMYDTVPHTRPLLVSGYGMGKESPESVRRAGILPIVYRGPSTMVNLITKRAADAGIEALVFIVSLPQYVVLDEDYLGKTRIMEVLNRFCGIPIDRDDLEKALEQRNLIEERVNDSPDAKIFLPQLERAYDMRIQVMEMGEAGASAEIERMFWTTLGKDIGKA